MPAAALGPVTADATIIMLTAMSDGPAQDRARDAGADLFLTKPFSPLRLLRLVDELGDGRTRALIGSRAAGRLGVHIGYWGLGLTAGSSSSWSRRPSGSATTPSGPPRPTARTR